MEENKNPLNKVVSEVENQIKTDFVRETEKFKKQNGTVGTIVLYCGLIVLIICSLILINIAFKSGASAFNDGYEEQKTKTHDSIYDYFKEKAKQKYLVSNKATIKLGNIREESNLEVLKVIESAWIIQNDEQKQQGVTRWVKYVGEGIFTVDLTESEFLVNDNKHYVLIRIPEPAMTEFGILSENTEPLLYAHKKFLDDGSYKEGADLSIDFHKRAESTIEDNINNNQNYLSQAKEAAIEQLTKLVKLLNPSKEMADLIVEIEFID